MRIVLAGLGGLLAVALSLDLAADTSGPSRKVRRAPVVSVDWDGIMKHLRAGGAYDDPDRPEGKAFRTVTRLGKKAYLPLISYIDNEDPLLGRAAVAVLNELTGRTCPLPNQRTNVIIKSQWESWYKSNY